MVAFLKGDDRLPSDLTAPCGEVAQGHVMTICLTVTCWSLTGLLAGTEQPGLTEQSHTQRSDTQLRHNKHQDNY